MSESGNDPGVASEGVGQAIAPCRGAGDAKRKAKIIQLIFYKEYAMISLLFTDWKILGYRHDFVDHDAGEYVRGEVHTQMLDGY